MDRGLHNIPHRYFSWSPTPPFLLSPLRPSLLPSSNPQLDPDGESDEKERSEEENQKADTRSETALPNLTRKYHSPPLPLIHRAYPIPLESASTTIPILLSTAKYPICSDQINKFEREVACYNHAEQVAPSSIQSGIPTAGVFLLARSKVLV